MIGVLVDIPDAGVPDLIVDDLVHVGVILRQVARRIVQIVKEVGTDPVAAVAPHVPLGVFGQHRMSTTADFLHVHHLPRGVVQEGHRGCLNERAPRGVDRGVDLPLGGHSRVA